MDGDKAFVVSSNPTENASIDDSERSRLVLMADGYKTAGDLLVKAAKRGPIERDTLVFPIIFNYRHFLEISLKYLLATYGGAVGIAPNWKSHNLEMLWESILELFDKYHLPDTDGMSAIVGKIVMEFANIDPNSYAYRYPVDQKGQLLSVKNKVYLPTLATVMNRLYGYFNGCDGLLDSLQGINEY